MNRKNTLTLAGVAVVCGLGAWLLGRQINSHPETTSASAERTAQPASSAPILKSVSKTTTGMKAPQTPVHEKAFLEEQLKTNPNHPPILLRLAELERADGKLTDARQHLEQAVKSDPKLIDARLELSLVAYQLGDAAEAEKQNRAILQLDSKQTDALYNMGALCANQNRYAEARQFWSDAVKYGKDTPSGKNAALGLAKLP